MVPTQHDYSASNACPSNKFEQGWFSDVADRSKQASTSDRQPKQITNGDCQGVRVPANSMFSSVYCSTMTATGHRRLTRDERVELHLSISHPSSVGFSHSSH
jgi:hypothetical protein